MNTNDEVLKFLINQAEKNDVTVTIGLHINGEIIEGKIISYHKYLDRFLKVFSLFADYLRPENSSLPVEKIPALNAFIVDMQKFVSESKKGTQYQQENMNEYIHLDEVLIYSGHSQKPLISEVWRGRLSSISGFSITKVTEIGREGRSYYYSNTDD